ncbi:MAG TPA: hypothetical protein VFQ85_07000 [Mycobacteriales bacterium]|nr:hypothetical protein [Mycobacteriales bacterium]
MSRSKAQRGPLLSSVVMVMLATVATGLLAFIGFQTGLVDSVLPTSSNGDDHQSRHVRVTDSPEPTPQPGLPTATANVPTATAQPTTGPTAVRTPDRPAQTRDTNGSQAKPVVTTAPQQPPKTTTGAKPKPTTSPSATKSPSPSPSSTTQAPTPAPTCGTGRQPRCPRTSPNAVSTSPTSTGFSSYSFTSSSTSSNDPVAPVEDKSAHKRAKAKRGHRAEHVHRAR